MARARHGVVAAALATLAVAASPAHADPPVGPINPGFERGLEGWTRTGTAFDAQPTYQENVMGSRIRPVRLGGTYWTDVPVPIGVRGDYWIGTYERRPNSSAPRGQTQGDEPTGTLVSDPFTLPDEAGFLSFLIGGGDDARRLKIELLLATNDAYAAIPRIEPRTGLGSELLRRDGWDVSRLDRRAHYVVVITDSSSRGHLSVDDLRFETREPSALMVDGHPAVLPTTINGRAVWTDYDAPLWGAADLHTHPMSHLSMGGKLMHGAPDIGSIAPAGTIRQGPACNLFDVRTTSLEDTLPDCGATHGGWGLDNLCGDTLRSTAINRAYDTDFKYLLPLPSSATCASGQSMELGLCYTPCNPGYHGVGSSCIKDCPAGFPDDGLFCRKPAGAGRGVGYLLQNSDQADCQRDNPQGCEQQGAIWYPRCPPGFHGIGPTCTKDCPGGFGDIGLLCTKPAPYYRGSGYLFNNEQQRCEADHPQGCDHCGAPWYPKCSGGFHEFACEICSPDCPAGMTEVGPFCQKNGEHGRGVGYLGHTDDRGACERDHPQGCEQCGAPFYPVCAPGLHPLGCTECSVDCPGGMTDIGISCAKVGTYDRGAGTTPLSNLLGEHQHAGWPAMAFWPHASSKAHQQMYVDWIERAHDGGLNLLVALAVNNELLGRVFNGGSPQDDQASADRQLDEIRGFIARHDFMREVGTAVEMRQAIKDGKLAVVVGIEVDNLGNFNVGNPLLLGNDAAVKAEIQRLYSVKGVRYVFPLHFADNVLGGVAVKGPLFNLSNRFARTRPLPPGLPYPPGFLYDLETASDPLITFRMNLFGNDSEWAHGLTLGAAQALLFAIGTIPSPAAFDPLTCPIPILSCTPQFRVLSSMLSPDSEWDRYQLVPGGQVNARGLTATGEVAIREMMRLGMFIDIDHMSDKAATRTLELAQLYHYPVNSGHTGFRAQPRSVAVNENDRSAAQLTQIGALGGMMGVGWAGGDAQSFLDSYRFGLQHGGVETCTLDVRTRRRTCVPTTPPAFSLGSDINGFEETPRARAGAAVVYCPDEASCAAAPGALRQYAFGIQADGMPRLWDYNTDGVAHIGLYPDIYQDLANLGLTAAERASFFNATEAFARMWDKMEIQKAMVP